MIFCDETGDYSIPKLWDLTKHLPVETRSIQELWHNLLETDWQSAPPIDGNYASSLFILSHLEDYPEHLQRVNDADLTYPILITKNSDIIDGMHRLCKCIREQLSTIDVRIVSMDLLKRSQTRDNKGRSPMRRSSN